jgi:hypothetical protein
MRIYNRNGWIETTDESGARETCQRHPDEWTLRPWTRPFGHPEVNVPDDFEIGTPTRQEELADAIIHKRTGEQRSAIEIIRAYVTGSQHPEVNQ